MSEDKFDSIVVGAGPAGVATAITMARTGLNVALLERGEYAGVSMYEGRKFAVCTENGPQTAAAEFMLSGSPSA